MPPPFSTADLRAPAPPYALTRCEPTDRSPDTEWLLTVGNGGYALGCASLLRRRRYHALLIASLNPPVDRLTVLAALDETLLLPRPGADPEPIPLFSHRLGSGDIRPQGWRHLIRFEKETDLCRWTYALEGVEVTKELRLAWRRNTCAIRYSLRSPSPGVRLLLAPRLALRDFHTLTPTLDPSRFHIDLRPPSTPRLGPVVEVRTDALGARRVALIASTGGEFTPAPSALTDLLLDFEAERHQDDRDSLFTPGLFAFDLPRGASELTLSVALAPDEPDLSLFEADPSPSPRKARRDHARTRFLAAGPPSRAALLPLVDAGEDFLATRPADDRILTTVLAGFPWFADWGRDTMISLPGLMLLAGRPDEARDALRAFARHVSRGMIPNLFADQGGAPEYNTVDASLWFIHACGQYLKTTGDRDSFDADLLPACLDILDHYQSGTRFGIRMDEADALIIAGDESTQLTWMDARRNGVVFTPRHGKPVEISALWYNALLTIAAALDRTDAPRAHSLRSLARRTGVSFRERFWNSHDRRLFDCLRPEPDGSWRPVAELRPNQIFAVSLPHSPLNAEQAGAVVECVGAHLLTPFGLRTLAPTDPNYQPFFDGDMMSRDRAYHNGTVWPWLIGPYCEALLRARDFSDEARAEARAALAPLLASMDAGCLGHIAEVYEAEGRNGLPRRAQACVAQAWSVAEVLRAAILADEAAPSGGR